MVFALSPIFVHHFLPASRLADEKESFLDFRNREVAKFFIFSQIFCEKLPLFLPNFSEQF